MSATRYDPFVNETELLKQIALFERKASALERATSKHGRGMRALYLTIVASCRDELRGLGDPRDMRSDNHPQRA